jgi:uncharacterized phage protein (predicted DNA packaging)
MAYVDLDLVKQNLRLDSDDEDELLQSMIDAATEYIRPFLDHDPDSDVPPSDPPPQLQQAMLMLIAAWFENRQTIVGTSSVREIPKEIPYGVQDVLRNLRAWTFG